MLQENSVRVRQRLMSDRGGTVSVFRSWPVLTGRERKDKCGAVASAKMNLRLSDGELLSMKLPIHS